jgi:hypothetical protein
MGAGSRWIEQKSADHKTRDSELNLYPQTLVGMKLTHAFVPTEYLQPNGYPLGLTMSGKKNLN